MSSVLERPQTSSPSLFCDRRFLLLWLAQVVSSLGDAALLIAVPFTLYATTHSKTALSVWTFAGALPLLLVGLVAGVYVDRWDRRRTMIVSDLGRAACVALLFFVRGPESIALFYVSAFLTGIFSTFFSPARTALMATLLPQDRLMQANAASTSSMQVMLFAGPALGAAILGGAGPQAVYGFDTPYPVYGFDVLTFLVSALLVAFVPGAPQKGAVMPRSVQSVWRDAGDGLRHVAGSRVLGGVLTLLVIVLLGAGIFNTLEAAFARDLWHVTGRQFGLLMAVFGAGSILGGLLVAVPLRHMAASRLIALAFGIMAVAGVGVASATDAVQGGLGLFALGIGNMLVNIPMLTLFQTAVPHEMLGRVTATANLLSRAALLAAAGLAGALAGTVPLRPLFAGLSFAYILCALLALPLLEGKRFGAEPKDVPVL